MLFSRNSVLALGLVLFVSCSATPGATTTNPKPASNPAITPPAKDVPRSDFWLDRAPVQGGLVKGFAPTGATKVSLSGAELNVDKDGYFLFGFDRDATDKAVLEAKFANGKSVIRTLTILPGNWRIENVNTSKTGGAATTKEFAARRDAELARIAAARSVRSNSTGWRQAFIWPIAGRISGLFGAQRVYRGVPGSPHGGMDIAAASGAVFVAPADGVVVLAAQDAFTLEGHLLMIDHGMGLNSAFLHCSELLVKAGDSVKQGQPIGKVGMTGRASGPHLHWGMKWNAARVDPKLVVPPR